MYLVAYTASAIIPQFVVGFFWGLAIGFILDLPEHHIHYVLRQTWILKPGPNDTDHKPQSTMYGFVVPSSYIRMLAIYITNLLYYVTAIFWYEFLLEETTQHSCNPSGVDCFFIKHFWNILKFAEPLDCHHVPIGVSTVTCYKYKFDINGASWTAGRAFAISGFIIKALPACFLFLKRCDKLRYRTLQYPIALLCLLITLVLLIPAVQNISSPSNIYELWSILLGILLSLTVPFLDFKLIPASRQ